MIDRADMIPREEYSWPGDTWYPLADECPNDGETLYSNGTIDECGMPDCDYWRWVV